MFIASISAAATGRWSLLIAVAALFVIPVLMSVVSLLWWLVWGRQKGRAKPPFRWGFWTIVGFDKRISTSKTVAIVWTYTVAAALLSIVIARWLGKDAAYQQLIDEGLKAEYALLIGGPIGAAILAKGIVTAQVEAGTSAKPPADKPEAAQIVNNDEGDTDLGDLQYVLFNLVALIFFYGEFLRVPMEALPQIPDVLLGLTSVSAVGYVSKKVLQGPAAITHVKPDSGPVGQQVRLATVGLLQKADDETLLETKFGDVVSPISGTPSFTTTQGALFDVTVPAGAGGTVDLTMTAPGGRVGKYPAGFKIVPTIVTAALAGKPGDTVDVATTGVRGAPLANVVVKIHGTNVTGLAATDDTLHVTVPAGLPTGLTDLRVETSGGSATATFTVTS
jgi:hypothetical protein